MTAHRLLAHHLTRPHFNRKDRPARPRRVDIAAQFEAAGFQMSGWNSFEFVAYGITYLILPCALGHKVIGPDSETVFAYGTDPNHIADWILDWPNRVTDWLTADLPEGEAASDSAPACYGLAKGEY